MYPKMLREIETGALIYGQIQKKNESGFLTNQWTLEKVEFTAAENCGN